MKNQKITTSQAVTEYCALRSLNKVSIKLGVSASTIRQHLKIAKDRGQILPLPWNRIKEVSDAEVLAIYRDIGYTKAKIELGYSDAGFRYRLGRISGKLPLVFNVRHPNRKRPDSSLIKAWNMTKSFRGASRLLGLNYTGVRRRLERLLDVLPGPSRQHGTDL